MVETGAKEMGQNWTWIFFMIKGNLRMEIKTVFEPAEEGGFTVYVPSLPGCISEGETFEKAVENIIEALKYRYNLGKRDNLNFFRDSSGNEIDLVYNIFHGLLPIEIKFGQTIASDYFKGLKKFKKFSPDLPYGQLIIYAGDTSQNRTDVTIITINQFSELLETIDP